MKHVRKRGDLQSEHVRVRMAGVLSDPHAADVRYHVDCRASFMCPSQYRQCLIAGVMLTSL